MVAYRTGGMAAADARTWIATFVLDTGQVGGTIWVDGTFWLTFNIWVTKQAR